uniref:ELMO domain-containing protein n=1 Tax=Corethron hystrix TaxID=216773 RepID=A0A7S1B573_9STRA|mmetsp:Transcript_13078/g.28836  ORF Transcript_13078/g.28836 Transcript_13078/m.28836 type:complete len:626 (+) Transcript_13078:235-2112(+)
MNDFSRPTVVDIPPPKSAVTSSLPLSSNSASYHSRNSSASGNASFLLNTVTNAASAVSSATAHLTSATPDFNVFGALSLSTKNHAIPDRSVASQVLMFRQLLHTACKPGLRLSRAFQGTAAQRAVMHMPWWELGVEQTRRMVISYDNLITRLWLNAAVLPFMTDAAAASMAMPTPDSAPLHSTQQRSSASSAALARAARKGILPPVAQSAADAGKGSGDQKIVAPQSTLRSIASACDSGQVSSLVTERGLPPVPHEYWVGRIGFQQEDPVTDFRSGGVLSLAMLVYIVESCPMTHRRFLPGGDADMLPFAITSVNITDMLAKFLMLSKAVDRIDALLSSKPFWRMFADPNSLLVLQELSLDILCDVVVEKGAALAGGEKITVFDFPVIIEATERRVRDDLLGAGPKTVNELRHLAHRLRSKHLNKHGDPNMASLSPKPVSNSHSVSLPSPSALLPSSSTINTYGKKMLDADNYKKGLGKVAAAFSGAADRASDFLTGAAFTSAVTPPAETRRDPPHGIIAPPAFAAPNRTITTSINGNDASTIIKTPVLLMPVEVYSDCRKSGSRATAHSYVEYPPRPDAEASTSVPVSELSGATSSVYGCSSDQHDGASMDTHPLPNQIPDLLG